MKRTKRICSILVLVVSLFASVGFVSSSQVAGATPPGQHWYSPIFALGQKARTFFTCVIHTESRSTWTHPNTHDGDPAYPGQYGLFQFVWPSQNNAWDAYIFPVIHVEPRYASAYQQAEGAAIIWKLGDATNTWTPYDGCRV